MVELVGYEHMFDMSQPTREIVARTPQSRSIDALEQRILAAHASVASALHELCCAIADHAATNAHRLDGARDETEWVARRLALEPATARRLVSVAEHLDTQPALSSAFACGDLSIDQAAAVCSFVTPELDEQVTDAARGLTPTQIGSLGDELFPPQARDDAALVRERRLDMRWTDRRRVLRLSARLPLEQGLIVENALRRVALEQPVATDPDEAATEPTTFAARCADALVTFCETANVEAKLPPERASVILHVRPGHPPHLEGGGVVSEALARRLACDARVQAIFLDEHGIAHATRFTRTAPEPLQRVLRARDRTCRFPGCVRTAHLHAHHELEWLLGGETSADNMLTVCGRHHRFVHEHQWFITGRADAPVFRRPDGSVFTAGPTAHAPPRALAA
jgi:hypothetical protein